MSDFKDMVAADRDIWINPEEFADSHNLNGTVCNAVISGPKSQEQSYTGMTFEGYAGISGGSVTVVCRTADLPELPFNGQRFDLDGEIYKVKDAIDTMGMLTIHLVGDFSL